MMLRVSSTEVILWFYVVVDVAIGFYPAHITPASLILLWLRVTASQQILFSLAVKVPWMWPGSVICRWPLQGHGDSHGPWSFLLAHQKRPVKSFSSSGSAARAVLGAFPLHTRYLIYLERCAFGIFPSGTWSTEWRLILLIWIMSLDGDKWYLSSRFHSFKWWFFFFSIKKKSHVCLCRNVVYNI